LGEPRSGEFRGLA